MKNEILEKAIPTDEYPIPRYDVFDSSGSKIYDKIEIRLANTIKQAGTPLDTAHLFSDETREMSGLGEDASVNDALNDVYTNRAIKAKVYSVAVDTEGWEGDGPYTKTISVEGIKSTDLSVTDIVLQSQDADGMSLELESFSVISKIELGDGNVVVTAADGKPETNITLRLTVLDSYSFSD